MPQSYSPLNDATNFPAAVFGPSATQAQYAAGIAEKSNPALLGFMLRDEEGRRQAMVDSLFSRLEGTNKQRMDLNRMIDTTNNREINANVTKDNPELANLTADLLFPNNPMARPTGSALSATSFDKSRAERDKTASEAIKNLAEAGMTTTAGSIEEFLTGTPFSKGDPLSLRIAQLNATAQIQSAEIRAGAENKPKLTVQMGDGTQYAIELSPTQLKRYNEIKQQLSKGSGMGSVEQNVEAIIQTLIEVEVGGETPKIQKADPATTPAANAEVQIPNVSEANQATLRQLIEMTRRPEQKPQGAPISDTTGPINPAVQQKMGIQLADGNYRQLRYATPSGKTIVYALIGNKWINWLEAGK